jgi:hypothetical protein
MSVICWRSGVPIRVSSKGKAGPLEAGRGKDPPAANPERVTSEALKRIDNGVHLDEVRKLRTLLVEDGPLTPLFHYH